jgi:hypothetical protein
MQGTQIRCKLGCFHNKKVEAAALFEEQVGLLSPLSPSLFTSFFVYIFKEKTIRFYKKKKKKKKKKI